MRNHDDEWRNEALAAGWNAHAVEHLSALWKSLARGRPLPGSRTFRGDGHDREDWRRQAKTFEAFVREQHMNWPRNPWRLGLDGNAAIDRRRLLSALRVAARAAAGR